MSLDSDDKRLSVINMGSPWRGILPLPGTPFDEADRAEFLFLSRDLTYYTIGQSTPPTPNIVPVRFVVGPGNVVPVEIVTVYAPGVIYVKEYVGPANVVPIREAPSETPRVKVIVEV